jgi:hypothetical protein
VYTYDGYPAIVCADIVRLRRRLDTAALPARKTDDNLIVGTWNIRRLGKLHEEWTEIAGSPKRNLRALAYIAEIIRRFDVIAIQDILRETRALRVLVDDFLGPNWGLMLSDVSAGGKGNGERLGYLYDKRRVTPSGLADEIVLPPIADGDPQEQFDRTPYVVGFRAGTERFALLTAHIRYGDTPADRIGELRRLALYTAKEIRDRARLESAEETNLIVLGDFNIDVRREDDPLFAAFISEGLVVPKPLRDVQTNYAQTVKHYNQIAWFMGDLTLLTSERAGVIDFRRTLYEELEPRQVTDRISDHLPLWVEFVTDRSAQALARRLEIDTESEDPFAHIPDLD